MNNSISISEYNKILGKQSKKRRQPEGLLQTSLGEMLKGIWAYRFNPNMIYWTYSGAGERKPLKTGILQKRKGLNKGDFDYRFEFRDGNIMRVVYLEAKSSTGSLTKEQKEFMINHQDLDNVVCGTAKSIEEASEFLLSNKVFVR